MTWSLLDYRPEPSARRSRRGGGRATTHTGVLVSYDTSIRRAQVRLFGAVLELPAAAGVYAPGTLVPVVIDSQGRPVQVLPPTSTVVVDEGAASDPETGDRLPPVEVGPLPGDPGTSVDQRISDAEHTVEDLRDNVVPGIDDKATAANGRVTVASAPPVPADAEGKPEGALWYVYVGGELTQAWRLDDGDWVEAPLARTFIPQIDIGTGTFGDLSGVRVKAGTLLADRLAVGAADNLIVDPLFRNPDIRAVRTQSNTSFASDPAIRNGQTYASINAAAGNGNLFLHADDSELYPYPVIPGQKYKLSVWLRAHDGYAATSGVRPTIRWRGANGGTGYKSLGAPYLHPSTTWVRYEWEYVPPPGEVAITPAIQVTGGTAGQVLVAEPTLRPMVPSVLIEDGAVSAEKLAAELALLTRVIAGNPTGGRVELGPFGLRKYAPDGTTIDVDLSQTGQALFSGVITGSDIIGSTLKTAAAGNRVEVDTVNYADGAGDRGAVTFFDNSGDVAARMSSRLIGSARDTALEAPGGGYLMFRSGGVDQDATLAATRDLMLWAQDGMAQERAQWWSRYIEVQDGAGSFFLYDRPIYGVGNVATRDALVAHAATANRWGPTFPLFVWRDDLPGPVKLEVTEDGTTWTALGNPRKPLVLVERVTSNQAIGAATFTAIGWNQATEDVDMRSGVDLVAPIDGVYRVETTVIFENSGSGASHTRAIRFRITRGGTTTYARGMSGPANPAANFTEYNADLVTRLSAGDRVAVQAWASTALNIMADSGTRAAMEFLRP